MTFDSLQNFLDPDDHNKTIEGYPAPKRAVIIANVWLKQIPWLKVLRLGHEEFRSSKII